MNLEGALELARRGELYPGLILHGGTAEQRLDAAADLARTLLCGEAAGDRPCGDSASAQSLRIGPGSSARAGPLGSA